MNALKQSLVLLNQLPCFKLRAASTLEDFELNSDRSTLHFQHSHARPITPSPSVDVLCCRQIDLHNGHDLSNYFNGPNVLLRLTKVTTEGRVGEYHGKMKPLQRLDDTAQLTLEGCLGWTGHSTNNRNRSRENDSTRTISCRESAVGASGTGELRTFKSSALKTDGGETYVAVNCLFNFGTVRDHERRSS
ncbi:hypothetical protein EVAR_12806_1 [Eumeta japonica]|uniref:Uncharacterized protein n=1 Tax=Eumeta variegata TaxID=151549 RepID=A0A4C1UAS9_EUMVA|nr:hypothetical protein EVAR_12806_1 [Eumeta japonica]